MNLSVVAENLNVIGKYALLVVIGVVVLKIVLAVYHRSRDRRVDGLLEEVSEYHAGPDELFTEDTRRSEIDTLHVTRRVPELVPKFVDAVFGKKTFQLEGEISQEFMHTLREAEEKQQAVEGVVIENTEVTEISADMATTVEEFCSSDCDFINLDVEFDANLSMHNQGALLVVDNYNTPKHYTARLSFVRQRRRSNEPLYCPKCDSPIFGDSCIVCGYKALESNVGFALTFFSIVK